MQLFLAIELTTEIKEQLHEQLLPLEREYPQFIWVPKTNYHLTIEFFGEVEYPEALKRKIEDLLYDQDEFYLYAQGLDLFMSTKITIYLNFMRQKELEGLVDKVRNDFVTATPRKKFLPHLSLSKYKIPSKQQYLALKKKLERFEVDLEIPVKEVVLFQSLLGNRFPEYKKIAAFPLLPKKNHSAE